MLYLARISSIYGERKRNPEGFRFLSPFLFSRRWAEALFRICPSTTGRLVTNVQAHIVNEEVGRQARIVGTHKIDAYSLILVCQQVVSRLGPYIVRAAVVQRLQCSEQVAAAVPYLRIQIIVCSATRFLGAYVPPVGQCGGCSIARYRHRLVDCVGAVVVAGEKRAVRTCMWSRCIYDLVAICGGFHPGR